jgi:nitrate/TMAO reductase-like tetraheme cytochrome c subunit
MFKRLMTFLLSPSTSYSVLTLFIVGVVAGSAIFVGSAVMISATGTVEFCQSCHVMQTAYDEYKVSIHAGNRTGVIATCADCHLPHDYPEKLFVKASRITEVWGLLTGVIDTPEKYEQHRLAMAQSVWKEFEANQSAPCRGCHQVDKMASQNQSEHAVKAHQRAARNQTTCIVCHQGIAHKLPTQPLPENAKPAAPGEPVNCMGCHQSFVATLPESHPKIDKGSLRECVNCHVPGSKANDDSNRFYTYIHRAHKQRIECTGCHEVNESGFRLLVTE